MKKQKFASVWDAIEDTAQEAISMRAKSAIMIAIKRKVESMNNTQAKAAQLLGITQPRLSDLLRGKLNLFSLDALFELAVAAKLTIDLKLSDT